METFLLAVAGGMVGLVVVIGCAYLWIRRKLRGIRAALGTLAGAMAGIPPLRITLQVAAPERSPFNDDEAVDEATRSFEAAGYESIADYTIDEMEGVALRGFRHPRALSFGVVYDHPQAGVFGDVVSLFRDRTVVTVTTGPDSGMDSPHHAERIHQSLDITEPEAAGRLHQCLRQAARGREPVRKRGESFAAVFTSAYAMEMAWRIRRGGVTEDEVRRAAAAGGLEPPDEAQIQLVRAGWRHAIDDFVTEEITRAFEAGASYPSAEWERMRERLTVVHEFEEPARWLETLAERIAEPVEDEDEDAEERALDAARRQLEPLFATGVREGFAAAQSLLPEKQRHQRLGSVARPWAGDVYLGPEGDESGH